MYIFGTEVDDDLNNQVEYLDTEAKMLVRMGPSSRPPGTMNRLEECAVAWNDSQIVHIQPKGHLDIFNLELGQKYQFLKHWRHLKLFLKNASKIFLRTCQSSGPCSNQTDNQG